ncbi:hypothetical protein [Lentzea sp. NBRC 105346]|uniref:hypothetical protein n=1 Tax=Lentzea sp. NBRC 105346 TaxID=3032205 RepID=UPI002556A3F5|nr:hypothetical protein [Lentzea sp. NBRC 105346]
MIPWVLGGAGTIAVVSRVVLVAPELPSSGAERQLIDSAFAGAGRTPVDLQLRGYLWLTRGLDRYDSVLLAARELSIVATIVVVLSVVALVRARPAATGVAVAVLACGGPIIAVLTPIGPGVLAAAWTTLALALLTSGRQVLVALGVVAALFAVLTSPFLLVPLVVLVAVRVPYLAVVLAVLAFALQTLLVARVPVEAELPLTHRVVLLATAFTVAVPALWRRETRLFAVLTLVVAVQCVWLRGDVLLPTLAALSAVVLAGLVEALRPAAVLAAVAAVAGVVVLPPGGRWHDEPAVAAWLAENTPPEATFTAPAGLWSELAHAGLGQRVRRDAPATFDVVAGTGPGTAVARFGEYGVWRPDRPSTEDALQRVDAGAQLAANPRLAITDDVRRALRRGEVDLRAMTLLAGLAGQHQVVVTDARVTEPERGLGTPRRELVLSAVDGHEVGSSRVLQTWLGAQRPPYAPSSTRITPTGAVVTWLVQEGS